MKTKEEQPNAELLYITSETGDQVYDIPYGMTNAALNSMVGGFSRRVYQHGYSCECDCTAALPSQK